MVKLKFDLNFKVGTMGSENEMYTSAMKYNCCNDCGLDIDAGEGYYYYVFDDLEELGFAEGEYILCESCGDKRK